MNQTRSAVTALILSLALLGCSGNVSNSKEANIPSITVQGQGKVFASPDEATANFGITSEEKSLEKAYKSNTGKMNDVIQTVKKMGVEDKDIQTSSFSVQPVYAQDPEGRQRPNEILGFTVRQQLTVKVRDLSKVGDLIDKVIGSGTNFFQGIEFSSSKAEELAREARQKAAFDAKENAKRLAQNLDVKLGRLLSASDSYVQPYPAGKMAFMEARAFAPDIQAGSLEVNASCSAVYEINQ